MKEGLIMNYNKELFKEVFTALYQHFDEYSVHPSEITDIHKQLAQEYCQNALIYCYNTKNESEKNPIRNIIATGLLVNYLWNEFAGDDIDKYMQISAITDNYEISAEEIMTEIHLKDKPDKIQEFYKLIDEITNFIEFLTHQKGITIGDDGVLKDTLTVYYAVFLFCTVMDVWMDI